MKTSKHMVYIGKPKKGFLKKGEIVFVESEINGLCSVRTAEGYYMAARRSDLRPTRMNSLLDFIKEAGVTRHQAGKIVYAGMGIIAAGVIYSLVALAFYVFKHVF